MRKLIILPIIISLTGCMYQKIDTYDIDRAIYVCNGANNVVSIAGWATGQETVLCRNGTFKNLDDVSIPTN